MTTKSLTSIALICILLAAGAAGQSKPIIKGELGTKIDELLSRYAMYGFSGTVLVIKNDQVIIHKAYGLADIKSGRPNTLDSLYDVGSIAKTFTAAAILQLETAGKLGTDDPISKHLGEFPGDKSGITIHHLLTHTAGFKLDAGDAGITPGDSPADFLQKAKAAPLLSPPGEKYNYSNLGYGLLAMIIHKVSGQDWHAYQRKLLKQAGLSRTMLYGDSFPPEKIANGYIGRTEEDLQLEEPLKLERPDGYVWRKYTTGSGGVYSTTGDVYKWWQALHSRKVLSPEAQRKMFSLQAGGQGYGWNVQTSAELPRLYRGGLRGSYQSMLAHYPRENALLIFAFNKSVQETGALWSTIVWRNFESILSGRDYVVPPAVIPVVPEMVGRFSGEYSSSGGERLVVFAEGNSLRVGAIGQPAVDLLAIRKPPSPLAQREVHDASAKMIEWLIAGDIDKIKTAGHLPEKDVPVLENRWKIWSGETGKVRSFEILGVESEPGGGPRSQAFVRLAGEVKQKVVRLIWNWGQKRLAAWGDGIAMPAITKIRPESETSFVYVDFNTSQTLRLRFDRDTSGAVTALSVQSVDGRLTRMTKVMSDK